DQGEDPKSLPLLVLVWLRLLSSGGEVCGLSGILLGRRNRLGIVENLIVLIDDSGTVVVDHGFRGVTAKESDRAVGRPSPVGSGRPRGCPPGHRVVREPARVEIPVSGETRSDVPSLSPQNSSTSVSSVVASSTGHGNSPRGRCIGTVGVRCDPRA